MDHIGRAKPIKTHYISANETRENHMLDLKKHVKVNIATLLSIFGCYKQMNKTVSFFYILISQYFIRHIYIVKNIGTT